MTFGEKITILRKQLKWSQDELAKRIGTSAPIVGRYERDEIKPSIEVAAKIASELGVMLDYLVGNSMKTLYDKKLLNRIEEIENLSDSEKNKVYELLDMALTYNRTKQAFSS